MEKQDFESKIFGVIKNAAMSIVNDDKSVLSLKNDGELLEKLYYLYENFRNECKEKYFVDSNSLMDSHKIAACTAAAILTVLPIIFTDDGNPHRRMSFLANELLAVLVSLTIVKSFNPDFDKKESLNFPVVNQNNHNEGREKESYITWLCISLSKYREKPSSFNVLLFSNLLFMIEQYSLSTKHKQNE